MEGFALIRYIHLNKANSTQAKAKKETATPSCHAVVIVVKTLLTIPLLGHVVALQWMAFKPTKFFLSASAKM